MKFFQVEIISKSFLTDCFQVKEIQISPIVFQIVTGSFHDILIDFGSSGSIVDAKCSQKDSSAGRIPAPVMNADIDQGVNTQIHTPVYPGKPDGIFGRIRIIHKGGGIFIAVGFHVGCPAFHIAGGGAEYYAAKNYGVQVIGCPKTIDGDLKNDMIETSFGFDTACKTYSEVIGNIQRDCNSARKYWHFIKLMGRSASHIALECALQVQPNMCIISEEVEAKDMSLDDIVTSIAKVVAERAAQGNNFGTVLIPEGLVEFIPAMKRLIAELNDFLAANAEEFAQIKKSHQRDYIIRKLSPENAAIYASLPEGVARQLSLDRDPHGNVQVSLIETEKLLSEMVGTKLAQWKEEGKFVGKFAAQHHFFGYEGRCAAPSNFDADYCYSLGYAASALIANGKTGYMSSVRNTTAPAEEWIAGGVPITMMMNMERRHGEMKPVIQKALVKLDGAPFKAFAAQRDRWAMETDYVYPGPIQYFGPTEVCDQATKTLQLEQAK